MAAFVAGQFLVGPDRKVGEFDPLLRDMPLTRAGLEGQAIVDFVVEPSGEVSRVVVERATGPDFGEEAVRAVAQWRFRPGKVSGRPVSVAMTVPILFSIRMSASDQNSAPVDRTVNGPVINMSEAELKPVPTFQAKPSYPFEMRIDAITDDVVVAMVINEKGIPCRVRATKASEYAFAESAVAAVRQWSFRPGEKEGQPINVAINIVVEFTISD